MDLLQRAKDSLRQKEVEMAGMEERYKKHIEKAKIVLQSLNTHHSSTPEVAALISQLKEKDKLIERLERETEHHKALRETEDQLVTTAFYNLVLSSHYYYHYYYYYYYHTTVIIIIAIFEKKMITSISNCQHLCSL